MKINSHAELAVFNEWAEAYEKAIVDWRWAFHRWAEGIKDGDEVTTPPLAPDPSLGALLGVTSG